MSSMMGKEILNIIVMIMMLPMLIYQSAARLLYFPWKRKPTCVMFTPVVNFMLRRIIITPILRMRMKERLTVKLRSSAEISR